jgi:hypothetical protein
MKNKKQKYIASLVYFFEDLETLYQHEVMEIEIEAENPCEALTNSLKFVNEQLISSSTICFRTITLKKLKKILFRWNFLDPEKIKKFYNDNFFE